MGHLMLSTMNKIRSALDALDLKSDGVDGPKIYVYGEAWDFGEVMCNQRGRNASQMNLAGGMLQQESPPSVIHCMLMEAVE